MEILSRRVALKFPLIGSKLRTSSNLTIASSYLPSLNTAAASSLALFDLIYSFTGLEIAVWDEPLCSLRGFFWTRFSLLAKLYLRAIMISLMDCSAKVGLSGSSLIEFELSWLKRSQSSIFSKLMSWIINLVVFWSFSMVMVFCLYLSSFIFATSLMSMFLSPFYWACS